ncbi:MAG: SPOR domain-containing protein [Planctomycetota bacterium]
MNTHPTPYAPAAARTARHRLGVCLGALLVAFALVACKGPADSGTLTDARLYYDAGNYPAALEKAGHAARAEDRALAESAAYIAGLSAARLDRPDLAAAYLADAAESEDPALAADASAELGLLERGRNRHAAAVPAFERAARGFTGDDRARALLYAAISQQRLGRWTQARTNLLAARAAVDDPALLDAIDKQLPVTGYTLQVGAYSDRTNAQTAASQLVDTARAVGLARPTLARGRSRTGQTLHLVQIGQFATFEAAVRARNRLDTPDAFVVPLSTY